jgi:hypothetical protein
VTSASIAVVIQICLPSITGDDQPRPGSGVFQTMFSVSLQVIGRSWAATAWP